MARIGVNRSNKVNVYTITNCPFECSSVILGPPRSIRIYNAT